MLGAIAKEMGRPIKVRSFVNIMSSNILSRMIFNKRFLGGFIPNWFDPQGLDARFRKLRARVDVFSRNVIEQHKEDRRMHPISEGQKTLLDVVLDQLEHPEHDVTYEHVKGIIWVSNL
jgi:hypothetical protein